MRNFVLVGSREDNMKQNNFRGDEVLKTLSHGEVTEYLGG